MYRNRQIKEVLAEILKDVTYKNVIVNTKKGYEKVIGENLFTRDVRPDRITLSVENEVVTDYYIG